MNYSKKIFQKVMDAVDWVDLCLVVLNSGIGLALTHILGYLINWKQTGLFIFWLLFFYLGNAYLAYILNGNDFPEKDQIFRRYLSSVSQLLAVLFFSLSFIPLVQIVFVSIRNYVVIYLICIFGVWLLLKQYFYNRIQIFGISESISSFMISFLVPLIILNIHGIRIHEILIPVSFFLFLQIIAYKFIKEIDDIIKRNTKLGFEQSYIGIFTILRSITVLIPFGYAACIFLIFIQNRIQLMNPLLYTFPIAAFFVYKIFQATGNRSEKIIFLKPMAIAFVLIAEAAWIFGLWKS
jgi:hypothetical protein